MRPGSFILNNKYSEEYGIVIQERPEIDTPRRKVEFKTSFGQDGDSPFDEEAYENTEIDLLCYIEGSTSRTASDNRDIVYDLFDSPTYVDFIPYFDPHKIYKVMVSSPPVFTSKYYMGEGQSFVVSLTIKPYKYRAPEVFTELTAPGALANMTSKTALPLIRIYGSGDITLTVNGVAFVMQDIIDHIILDSQIKLAYKYVGTLATRQNHNTYTREFPYLSKGVNLISWTGNVSKIEIEPRWRTLA